MDQRSIKNSPLLLALAGGLTGALVALAGQYAITYQSIERPKLELEAKKVDIETYKLGLALLPVVESSCTSKRFEKSSWRVRCQLVNKGQYPIVATMLSAAVHSADDRVGLPIAADSSLTIQISNWKGILTNTSRTFDIPPGVAGREFEYVARYERKDFPDLVARPDIILKTTFEFQTIDAPVRFLRTKFPDADGMLSVLSKSTAPTVVSAVVLP